MLFSEGSTKRVTGNGVGTGLWKLFFFFFFFFSGFYPGLVQLFDQLVFHSGPGGPLGHLLCRGLSQCPFFVFSYQVAVVGFEPPTF